MTREVHVAGGGIFQEIRVSSPGYGCGWQNRFGISQFGVFGAPPILEPILAGIGMFTRGTSMGVWTHIKEFSSR